MAILTSGQVIAEELGLKLENVTIKDLGQASGISVDSSRPEDNTIIIDGAGTKKDIEGRCAEIRGQVEATSSDYDREKRQGREPPVTVREHGAGVLLCLGDRVVGGRG